MDREATFRSEDTGVTRGFRPFFPSYKGFMYNLYTIWLFTYSDLKSIVGPMTAFGVFNGIRAHVFGMLIQTPSQVSARLPLVALWTWINLLPFSINNQRRPEAVEEDSINKPWRPLPSKRVTPVQAKHWMYGFYLIAVCLSAYLGGLRQCLSLLLLGFWYNDFGGADHSPIIRNLINACGFVCYTSGALEVAYGAWMPLSSDSLLFRWLSLIGAVVFSTVHTQDMYDQAGDNLRGRRTVPLWIGDKPSRVTIAIPMAFWSCFVPWFWNSKAWAYTVPLGLGSTVLWRTLSMRDVEDDKRTFLIWNLWLVALYSLPLLVSTSI